jgi:hypothetical protein
MASTAHLYAAEAVYHANQNYDAIKQSMIAEFALAYRDIPNALHNYTVLAIKSNSTAVKQRALNIALEHEDLNAALDISTHWVVQEPQDVPALFYLAHIALKAHEYELAAETLEKILKIDDNADLEEILAGIAPDEPDDREYLIQGPKYQQSQRQSFDSGAGRRSGSTKRSARTGSQYHQPRLKKTSKVDWLYPDESQSVGGIG